tara:strand:+ start:64 stop:285 length:222 start_codon:yes stop_codon:yes gene_type:complete
MENIKQYIYHQIYSILIDISNEYNLSYEDLKNKYMESYSDIEVEEININNTLYYMDNKKQIYNKNGFIVNLKM